MNLITTDDPVQQIAAGREIYEARQSVYNKDVMDKMYGAIRKLKKHTPPHLSEHDVFYLSVYNYWRYGFVIKELYRLHLFDMPHSEKMTYISNMDKLNYTGHLNRKEDVHLLSNKYETWQILKDLYGRDLIYVSAETGHDEFRDFMKKHSEFVIKPVGLATSIGVRKCSLQEYGGDPQAALSSILQETEEVTRHYRWSYGSGIVVEEVIRQGEELGRLHPASVNSVRITTLRTDDGIHMFCPVVRIGLHNEFLCAGSVGSIVAGINTRTGITETDGYTEEGDHFVVHPDTGITIRGIAVPKWEELLRMAEEIALKFENLGYIGWDFVYTEDGKWIVLEGNENGGFIGQLAWQRGLFKEFTDLIKWKSPKKYWWIGRYPE